MNGLLVASLAACFCVCLSGKCNDTADKRIYTFGASAAPKPFMFINDEGEVAGFVVDIVRAVCRTACKKCEFVFFSDTKMCWDPLTKQSIGLSNRYFDVCPGWVSTKERELVYSHMGTFFNEQSSALFVRQNSTKQAFDPERDRIGFLMSHRADEVCLKDKKGWEVKSIFRYQPHETLHDRVMGGKIDVAFMVERLAESLGGLRKISESIFCATQGHGLMMRKDVTPDYAWFPPALKELMASGEYRRICHITEMANGGEDLGCLTTS